MFKANNKNTRMTSSSLFLIKLLFNKLYLKEVPRRRSGIFIVNVEHIFNTFFPIADFYQVKY